MMSIFGFGRLTREQRRLWQIGGGVIVFGSVFKYAYFNISRKVLSEDMDSTHLLATKHLNESREFAKWANKDRQERLPPLTKDQRKQLHRYLELLAENNPEVYPRRKA